MSLVIIDNYDSFTYNLVHLFKKLITGEVSVMLNDKVNMAEIEKFDRIVLSPGPGIPSEAGSTNEVIRKFGGKKPILGVCLGHQAIAEAYGATLNNLNEVYHGVATEMNIVSSDILFQNIPDPFMAGRYHSWVVNKPLPDGFQILAEDTHGHVMAFVNYAQKLYGVQFHPESILTPQGELLMANWLSVRWQ